MKFNNNNYMIKKVKEGIFISSLLFLGFVGGNIYANSNNNDCKYSKIESFKDNKEKNILLSGILYSPDSDRYFVKTPKGLCKFESFDFKADNLNLNPQSIYHRDVPGSFADHFPGFLYYDDIFSNKSFVSPSSSNDLELRDEKVKINAKKMLSDYFSKNDFVYTSKRNNLEYLMNL